MHAPPVRPTRGQFGAAPQGRRFLAPTLMQLLHEAVRRKLGAREAARRADGGIVLPSRTLERLVRRARVLELLLAHTGGAEQVVVSGTLSNAETLGSDPGHALRHVRDHGAEAARLILATASALVLPAALAQVGVVVRLARLVRHAVRGAHTVGVRLPVRGLERTLVAGRGALAVRNVLAVRADGGRKRRVDATVGRNRRGGSHLTAVHLRQRLDVLVIIIADSAQVGRNAEHRRRELQQRFARLHGDALTLLALDGPDELGATNRHVHGALLAVDNLHLLDVQHAGVVHRLALCLPAGLANALVRAAIDGHRHVKAHPIGQLRARGHLLSGHLGVHAVQSVHTGERGVNANTRVRERTARLSEALLNRAGGNTGRGVAHADKIGEGIAVGPGGRAAGGTGLHRTTFSHDEIGYYLLVDHGMSCCRLGRTRCLTCMLEISRPPFATRQTCRRGTCSSRNL